MSYLRSVRSRELHGPWDQVEVKPRLTLYRIFENFTCYKEDEHNMTAAEEGGVVPLPFSCSYSSHSNSQHVVAVANEDGKVHLIDTQRRKGGCITTWQAHVNAVFDIAWVPADNKLVTGSGDQTAQLWDVPTTKCVSVFKGHTCSLRSISFKHNHSAVFATGARDGNVMIWDTRTRPMKTGHYKPVNILHGVHTTIPTTGTANNRRSNSARNTEAQQSVTTVLFKDENNLYSSGAADGTIKMWDIRRYYTTAKGVLQPKHVYPYVGTASRKHGISALSLTSCGSRLFSSCTDDNIYMYNTHLDTRDPVAVFSGHTNSTFYVKSCVSRDNEFLISGSSSHSLFVWDIKHPLLPPVKLDGHSGEVTSVASSSCDLGQIVSCSDDNTVRIWRLHDQTSLCKEGFKCGSAARASSHTPVLMTSLNLHDREDFDTTPVRPAARTTKITRITPRGEKVTPSRRDSNHGNDTTLTPSRPTPTSRFTPTPSRQDKNRLRAIVEDEQAPASSQEWTTSSKIIDKTPVRSPVRQSPRCHVAGTSSTAHQRTPGKISAYFRSNGLLSSEKRKVEQSPVRQSPRLNKVSSIKGGRQISTLELETANKLLTRKTIASKQPDEPRSSPKMKEQNVSSPRKKPKRKEKVSKNSTELCATPTKSGTKDDATSTSGRKQLIKSPRKMGSCSNRVDGVVSPDLSGRSVGTQSGRTVSLSVGTQTLSPIDCTSSCKGCCRNFPPLYSGPKSHTPASTVGVGGSMCTPSAVSTDLTPRSCSNSSIPRPKRIHAQADGSTTPTKGHALVLKQTSPDNKENSEQRIRRKFTKTGTPIHRYNCRCTFCVSSATEFSELSNSPILDMPSRPRKRLLSHEYSAESNPKKRKSLFRSGSEVGSDHTMRSCSPYLDNKPDCEERKRGGDQAITVTRWLGGKIGGSRTRSPDQSCDPHRTRSPDQSCDPHDEGSVVQDEGASNGVDNGTVSGQDDHDHSQCSTLHCIRSYFTKKS